MTTLPEPAGRDAEKYLLDDETVVLATRRHWAVLVQPVAGYLPLLLAGGWLFLLDPQNRVTTTVGLLAVLVALGVLGLRFAEWSKRHLIVTKRRVLLTSGVVIRTVTLLPLRRVTDLTWEETFFGQLLGYGTFRFESAGQDQALRHLTFMPDAKNVYKVVSRLLFSSDWGGAGGGDDEGNPESPPPPRPPSARRDTEPIPPLPPPR